MTTMVRIIFYRVRNGPVEATLLGLALHSPHTFETDDLQCYRLWGLQLYFHNLFRLLPYQWQIKHLTDFYIAS